MAAELAAGLVDGEPCAVCGADEHPRPAAQPDSVVTKADEDAARAAEQTARTRSRRVGTADEGGTGRRGPDRAGRGPGRGRTVGRGA